MTKLSMTLLLALAACGGKKDNAPDPSAACGEAAKAATDALIAPAVGDPNVPAEQKTVMKDKGGKLQAVLQKRCVEDKWSADVIACYRAATSMNDMRGCRAKLPADQGQKVLSEEVGVMSAR